MRPMFYGVCGNNSNISILQHIPINIFFFNKKRAKIQKKVWLFFVNENLFEMP